MCVCLCVCGVYVCAADALKIRFPETTQEIFRRAFAKWLTGSYDRDRLKLKEPEVPRPRAQEEDFNEETLDAGL